MLDARWNQGWTNENRATRNENREMKLFVPKEADAAETRVPLLPADAGRLVQLGANVEVQGGIGESINIGTVLGLLRMFMVRQ